MISEEELVPHVSSCSVHPRTASGCQPLDRGALFPLEQALRRRRSETIARTFLDELESKADVALPLENLSAELGDPFYADEEESACSDPNEQDDALAAAAGRARF